MLNYTNINSQGDVEPNDEAVDLSEQIQLSIKLNEESSDYECAICGDERVSAKGPELFLAETWDLVCDECGRRHAPLLAALIDLSGAAEGYVAVRHAIPPEDV